MNYLQVKCCFFHVCTLPQTSVSMLTTDLNTRHESIKFDYEISKTQITFLDPLYLLTRTKKFKLKYIEEPQIQLIICASLLHIQSFLRKINVQFSQAFRLKHICSEEKIIA